MTIKRGRQTNELSRHSWETAATLPLQNVPAMSDQSTGYQVRSVQLPEALLTVQEAADYLRLTPGALYTQRYRGEDPGALGIRVGKKLLYRTADIDRFLDERLAETQAGRGQ